MSSDEATKAIHNREFISQVRSELALAGNPDVRIERDWIDEATPGERFLLRVPVGTELVAPLRPTFDLSEPQSEEDRTRHAREFAAALVNLKSAGPSLQKYANSIRRAANVLIVKAQQDGVDVRLDSVGLKPTYARHLAWGSWKEAMTNVLAEVEIRHTSFYLQPTTTPIRVEKSEDLEEELRPILEKERERRAMIAGLEARGTDLVVDAITLDLLAAHGLDAGEVLGRVWREQCVNMTVRHRGMDAPLSLISSEGRVEASIRLEDAFWSGEHLWFLGDEHEREHLGLVGGPLGDLVKHPTFTERPVAAVERRPVDLVSFDLSDKLLFDGDTCRIWREERLAA